MAMNRTKLVVLLGFLAAVPLAAACGGSGGAGMANSAPVRAGAPAAAGVQAQANGPAPAKAPAQQPKDGVSAQVDVKFGGVFDQPRPYLDDFGHRNRQAQALAQASSQQLVGQHA